MNLIDKIMNIRRTYEYISKSELPKKQFIFKRIMCEHDLVDNILTGESGLSRINGEDHIVYCTRCGHIEGYYSKEYY